VTLPQWSLPAACTGAAVALVAWNLTQGVRLSSLPDASRPMRMLASLSAFLLLPSMLIAVLAPTAPGARVLGPLAWMWPMVTVGVLVAGVWSAGYRRAPAFISLSLTLFNLFAAWVALARWLAGEGVSLPAWALAPGALVSSLAAEVYGDAHYPWAAALLMPALVPATPSRRRLARLARAVLIAGCAVFAIGIAAGTPRAFATLVALEALAPPEAPAAPRAALAIGLRCFGDLSGSPSAAAARRELALADSLGVSAVHVALRASGTGAAALDSVSRALAPRRDSVVLVVTLLLGGFRPGEGGSGEETRLEALDRVVRRLRPDVLVPAELIPAGRHAPALDAWVRHYDRVAEVARRADRRIVVALGTEARTDTDSAAVEWVMQRNAPVRAIALAVSDHGAHPERFLTALASISRWASFGLTPPDVWLLGVPTAPAVTGEVVQQRLVRYTLAWATARPWVRGVIAGEAGDITAPTALQTATGRRRRAVAEVAAALRAQRDLSPALDAADGALSPPARTPAARPAPAIP
jgi:hypothetical protein